MLLPGNSKVSCHPDGQTLTRHPLLRHTASAVVYQNSEESHLRPDVSGSGLLGTREDFGLCSQPVFASGWWGEWGGGLRQPPWKCRLGKGGCLVPLHSRGPPPSLQTPQAARLLPPRGPSLPLLPWASCSTGSHPPPGVPACPAIPTLPRELPRVPRRTLSGRPHPSVTVPSAATRDATDSGATRLPGNGVPLTPKARAGCPSPLPLTLCLSGCWRPLLIQGSIRV